MAWIAIHDEVRGRKLRALRKAIGTSEAEALGILTIVWLWARTNADNDGFLENADKEDIAAELDNKVSGKLDTDEIVNALIKTGWIDETENGLYVHDWFEWQGYWFRYLENKERDRIRKREERQARRQAEIEPQPEPPAEEPSEAEPEKKPKKSKAPKPPKTEYAEFVKMYPEQYDKLVERFGEPITAKCIEKLDNYKGSTKKRYDDDYRAILSWVVDEIQKANPSLVKRSEDTNGNPFEEFM